MNEVGGAVEVNEVGGSVVGSLMASSSGSSMEVSGFSDRGTGSGLVRFHLLLSWMFSLKSGPLKFGGVGLRLMWAALTWDEMS